MPSLPLWVASWVAVGALSVAVASFAHRLVEYRRDTRPRLTVRFGVELVNIADNEPTDDGESVYYVHIVNTGAVSVRISHWCITDGNATVYGEWRGGGQGVNGIRLEPGDAASDYLGFYAASAELGRHLQLRAQVTLTVGGSFSSRRYGPSHGQATTCLTGTINGFAPLSRLLQTFRRSRLANLSRVYHQLPSRQKAD
jgi:uncharacterized protein affecting Mg2+/Co2+ transport